MFCSARSSIIHPTFLGGVVLSLWRADGLSGEGECARCVHRKLCRHTPTCDGLQGTPARAALWVCVAELQCSEVFHRGPLHPSSAEPFDGIFAPEAPAPSFPLRCSKKRNTGVRGHSVDSTFYSDVF